MSGEQLQDGTEDTHTVTRRTEPVKLAVIGVGNNISALVQGIALYRATGSLAGIRTPVLDGLLGVGDTDLVAAFAASPGKIGKDLTEAILLPPNNFPRIVGELPPSGVVVRRGLTGAAEIERVAGELAGAEVVLYAAPSGRPPDSRFPPRDRLVPLRSPAGHGCWVSGR